MAGALAGRRTALANNLNPARPLRPPFVSVAVPEPAGEGAGHTLFFMPSPSVTPRLTPVALAVFAGVAAMQWLLLRTGWPGLLPGIFFVALWCLCVALAQPLWDWLHRTATTADPSARRRRLVLLAALAPVCAFVTFLFVHLVWTAFRAGQAYLPGVRQAFDLLHDASAAVAFVLYFLRQMLASVEAPRRADPRGGIALLLCLLTLQAVAAVVRHYAPAWDFGRAAGLLALGVALFLPVEWALAWALRFFQPPDQRRARAFAGHSLALAMLGGKSPVQVLAVAIKESFGLEIRGSWLARYARLCIEPLLLVLVLAGWLSTSLVLVPPDSEAVRVTWGRFQPVTLGPGLHFIAPWPMERVRVVPSRRVQDFSLGFDQDLGGPVLWTEVHFAGESNLLVGNGEEVLTFNVPVHFDLSSPLAAERASAAPGLLLSSFAQRELLLATAPRESFGIMTTDRAAVSVEIQQRLQLASDRLGLGARIRYVGLKDIHPPVAVAPAYQEVISAREQRRMMIDLAAANRITGLATAQTEAFRARRQAESFAAERVAAVAGEAFLLTGKVDARRVDPELFDFRNRILVAEEVIPKLRLVLTDVRRIQDHTYTLDLREGANTYP